MEVKLYMFPGSHPCECAEAALRLKRISYTRVNLIPAFHKLVVRSHFPGNTVPALALGDERIIGSRAILRRLDELEPVPRLIPEGPELRARVDEADAWGDEVLRPSRSVGRTTARHRRSDELRRGCEDAAAPAAA